nr:ATP-binding cassette domain-containing protein [Candidatus Krumholzibacteria bacterium]
MQKVNLDLGGRSILRDINLEFEPGKMTLILGPSGSGVSALLKTAAGLKTPSSGHVLYDGKDYGALNEQEKPRLQTRTGFMFQDAALWANLSIGANLELPLQAKFPRLSKGTRRQMVADRMAEFGVSLDLKKRPVDLSLGEQKFISFLRAVLPDPEALFLDEPVAWLDQHWTDIIMMKLEALRNQGVVIVLGSHNSHFPEDRADRLVILDHGQVKASGNSKEISWPLGRTHSPPSTSDRGVGDEMVDPK